MESIMAKLFPRLACAMLPAILLSACAGLGRPPLMPGATEAEVVARLEALGFRHVWLGTNAQNARANAFYERLGFETIGARTFVVGGTRVEDDWVRLLSLG